MKRTITTSLSLLTAIALLCLSTAADAAEMKIVDEGKLVDENADLSEYPKEHPEGVKITHWKAIDGALVYVGSPTPWHYRSLWSVKAANGDCECKVTLSLAQPTFGGGPRLVIKDWGFFDFWQKLPQHKGVINLHHGRMVSKGFKPGMYDGYPEQFNNGQDVTLRIKRAGDVVSFYVADKKITERKIPAEEPLTFGFGQRFAKPKVKSFSITAEKFSESVETNYKVLFPSQPLFTGSMKPSHEYGKAYSYRIPALVVSKSGTVLAFAEARRRQRQDMGARTSRTRPGQGRLGQPLPGRAQVRPDHHLDVLEPCRQLALAPRVHHAQRR